MNREIRVLIADDHPIFRRGLRMVVESDPLLRVVAEAEEGETALLKIEEFKPEIAILDIDMPLADGLKIAGAIREKKFPTRAIFLTMHKDEAIFNAAIDLGVKGFVIKDSAANDIIHCIKSVANGQSFYSSILSQFLINRITSPVSPLTMLTLSERRILRLIAEGKQTKEIAGELFISPRTVEHHRANISCKLNLRGKNALLTFALTNKNKI